MRMLVDTNILIRWVDKTSSDHIVCTRVISHLKQSMSIYVCAQNLIEFYSVATRPCDVNGLGMDVAAAQQALTDILEALPCLPEVPDMARFWREVIIQNNVSGRQVHDARLVALMHAHDFTDILTLNVNDFNRYQGINPMTPKEVLDR